MNYNNLYNLYLTNIKNIISLGNYNFIEVCNLEVNSGCIKNYNEEKNELNRRGLLSFNNYNHLGRDILERGMYAPIYINKNNLILEGNHRVEGLKRIGKNLKLLCIYYPVKPTFIDEDIWFYKLNKNKNGIKKLFVKEIGQIIKYTVDLDMYLLTEMRLKMDSLPPASKFFTDKNVFNREMAEYEKSKISRN